MMLVPVTLLLMRTIRCIIGCKLVSVGRSTSSANKPKYRDIQAREATSGSSRQHSDEDDAATEADPFKRTADAIDLKRIRRY